MSLGNPCCERVRARASRPRSRPSSPTPRSGSRFARLRDRVEADARPPRRGPQPCSAAVEAELWAEADAVVRVRRPSAPSTRSHRRPSHPSTPRCIDSASDDRYGRPSGGQACWRVTDGAARSKTVEFNLADLLERVADTVPDHEALVCGDAAPDLRRARRPGEPARPRARRARRRRRRPRRALPLQLAPSISKACSPRSSSARCRST